MRRFLPALVLITLGSCGRPEEGVALGEVRIPGDWTPPESVMAISGPQYVDVVEPPPIAPDGYCPEAGLFTTCVHPACTEAHPGTSELAAFIFDRWSFARNSGTYSCRRNSGKPSDLSVHAVGRAIDIGIATIDGDADNTRGDEIANWLISNAEHIGVQRVIWDGMYWTGSRRNDHFREMCDTLAECRAQGRTAVPDHHTNHIHLELSVDAAARRTPFFRDGPPSESCPVVCYGTAAVREDCSYVDCAATGEVCLSEPVRCGPGAPPEPADAVHHPDAPLPSVATAGALSRFVPLDPVRLFDTRSASTPALSRTDGATSGPLTPAAPATVIDLPGLAPDTSSVWINVAAIPRTDAGFLIVHAGGTPPGVSMLNFTPPRVRANAVAAPVGGDGVTFTTSAEVDVVADLNGSFGVGGGLGLRTAGPLRVLDTRQIDAIVRHDVPLEIDVHAPDDALGVVASIAVIQERDEAGFLTVFPCGEPRTETSTINFMGGTVTANAVMAALGTGSLGPRRLCLQPTTPVHVVVDVTGYLVAEGELSYQALSPVRLLDSRDEAALYAGRLGRGQTITLPIQALPGMPDDVRAVLLNLTTISPGERGYVVAYPCDLPGVPSTSNLNFDSDNPSAATVITRIGAEGNVCLYSNARTFLVVDVIGAWVPTPGAPPPTDEGGTSFLPEDPAGSGFDAPDEASAGAGAGSGGCQVGVSGRPAASILALLGLVGLALRRRAR